MAKYSTSEISILLTSAALKAKVEKFDKRGFEVLSKAIDIETERPFGVNLDARYLKESIFDKLTAAGEEDKIEIGFNQDYIDTLSYYTGYNSFYDFQSTLKHWDSLLKSINSKFWKIGVIHDIKSTKAQKEVASLIRAANLESEKIPISNAEPDLKGVIDQICLAIVLVNQYLKINKDDNPFPELSKKSVVPLVFHIRDKDVTPNPEAHMTWRQNFLANEKEVLLIIALIKLYQTRQEENSREEGNKGESTINAENVGTIILGNNKVKAEYLSSRDMNITINKTSKNN